MKCNRCGHEKPDVTPFACRTESAHHGEEEAKWGDLRFHIVARYKLCQACSDGLTMHVAKEIALYVGEEEA